MADYLAGLPASVFVCDYDHNAPDAEHLEGTHAALYRRYRKSNPQTPIVFVSKPDIRPDDSGDVRRRDVVYQTYIEALRGGDERVYFLDGFHLFAGDRRLKYSAVLSASSFSSSMIRQSYPIMSLPVPHFLLPDAIPSAVQNVPGRCHRARQCRTSSPIASAIRKNPASLGWHPSTVQSYRLSPAKRWKPST